MERSSWCHELSQSQYNCYMAPDLYHSPNVFEYGFELLTAMDFCTWLEARNRILGPYAQSLFGNRSGFGSIVDQSNDSLWCFWQWWVGRYLFFIHLELHRTCAEHGFLEMELLNKLNVVSFLDFSKVGTAIFQGSICPLSLFSAHLASAASPTMLKCRPATKQATWNIWTMTWWNLNSFI